MNPHRREDHKSHILSYSALVTAGKLGEEPVNVIRGTNVNIVTVASVCMFCREAYVLKPLTK